MSVIDTSASANAVPMRMRWAKLWGFIPTPTHTANTSSASDPARSATRSGTEIILRALRPEPPGSFEGRAYGPSNAEFSMAVIDRLLAPDSFFARRFFFLAKRFIPGETIDSALETVAALNSEGLSASLDFLGEDVLRPEEAQHTRDTYLAMLAAIERSGARTNVSLKLTALGLLIDEEMCSRYLAEILARAATLPDPFVRIDMEGSSVTDATLRVFE